MLCCQPEAIRRIQDKAEILSVQPRVRAFADVGQREVQIRLPGLRRYIVLCETRRIADRAGEIRAETGYIGQLRRVFRNALPLVRSVIGGQLDGEGQSRLLRMRLVIGQQGA